MQNRDLKGFRRRGSGYRGSCDASGRRSGSGTEKWRNQEQKFEGTFVRDAFHGEGAYEWFTGRDRLTFEGNFYSNFKEGYGMVSLPDGSVFEGLFSNNRPLGPGIKTNANGRQDVGFWCGSRMVRLSRSVDGIVPRLASTSAGKLKLLRFQEMIMPFMEKDADVGGALLVKHGIDPRRSSRLYSDLIHDPRSIFFDRPYLDSVCFVKVNQFDCNSEGSPNPSEVSPEVECLSRERDKRDPCNTPEVSRGKTPVESQRIRTNRSTPSGVETDRKLRVAGDAGVECGVTQLLSWNRSELCVEMLKQIFRFRSFEEKLTFELSDLMTGNRAKFRKTGETERINLHFLRMCSVGPAYVVKGLLCSQNVSEALMDARGNSSIMFAVATDQHDVIELLLNYGVDVNAFNDENLTPLNLCLLRRIAVAASLGNWEISFLAPDSPFPGSSGPFHDRTEADARVLASTANVFADEPVKTNTWRAVESVRSIDRTFGDGMSVYDNETVHELGETFGSDSLFCFGDEDSQDLSNVTVFRYKTNEEGGGGGGGGGGAVSVWSTCHTEGKRDGTVKVDEGICPMSFKREEYLRSVAEPREGDRYFFQLNVEKSCREGEEPWRSCGEGVATSVRSEAVNEPPQEQCTVADDRIYNIDRTIEQLLRRGADPNLGDAPKPSLHLAVFSGEPTLVHLLLTYGAAPDSQTLPQEGLLTPLHVLVLMKPAKERVTMCELLLNYGASPEEETAPNFSPNGERDFILDPEHGRTPLQLLCTRPDAAEYPDGFLSQLAILLVRVSAKGHFFRGHSYLTLAMMSGNYSLMEALLTSKRTDPNEKLGRDLGTALHVLVSAELQKRVLFQNSIRMCDLLLEKGANPKLKFRTPLSLLGTCIDYGYREIEKERNRDDKSDEKYCLEEHVKVVEHLEMRAKIGPVKHGLGNECDERVSRGGVSVTADMENGAPGEGTTASEEERDGRGGGEDIRGNGRVKRPKDAGADRAGKETKVIEIKKHMEKRAPGKPGKAKDQVGRGSKKVDKQGKAGGGKAGGKSGLKGREKGGIGHPAEKRTRTASKGRNTGRINGRGSERLPERFRQSLLHMFGICGKRLDLNDFLPPPLVLRNGDLYYRFKGQKPAGTEQYSLI